VPNATLLEYTGGGARKVIYMETGALQRPSGRGFSLIELFVVIGIVAVVVSFIIPALGASVDRATLATSLSRIHQLHIGLAHYAGQFRDLPPTFGTPALGTHDWDPSLGNAARGTWFRQASLFGFAMSAILEDPNVVVAVGNKSPGPLLELWGLPARQGDFFLAETCYGHPRFFDWETQTGLPQFAPQPLSSVAFPSNKGLIFQWQVFHDGAPASACCTFDHPTSVCFADGSASPQIMKQMIPGMVNLYNDWYYSPGIDPTTFPHIPIDGTFNGNQGVDR